MKKVIEQGVSFIDIQHLTKTVLIYEKFNSRPEGKIITIDKHKAREVALAICPELESELAEKDKEIEILNARISELNKKTDDLLINIEELSNAIKKSLNK